MFVDIYHNHILKNTVTEGFVSSIEKKLIPKLENKFGSALLGVQMYEDYIADAFYAKGEWYYPLTVILPEGPVTEWVKWRMKAGSFKDGIPYAYIGEGLLEINIAGEAPAEFSEKLAGRATFSTSAALKVNIETSSADPTFLAGRYSQSFVDEMARQLTLAISEAMSVSGLDSSPLTLSLVFSPATYMEHTSENVTYRRLLITDGMSAPRDFWVKWTREDGAMAYSVSDHVSAENITFEIGEDVPQKVREKEYRFLLSAGGDKYHNAMGRKNITEWREIIKRAVKRGDLVKTEAPASDEQNADINAALAAVLGKTQADTAPAVTTEAPESDEFARAMALAMAIKEEHEAPAEDVFVPEIPAVEEAVPDREEETEISFEPAAEEPNAVPSIFDLGNESFEEIDDEEALEAESEGELQATVSELAALDGVEVEEAMAEEPAPAAAPAPTRAEIEAQIRAELEAKIRAEYEARIKAEAEAAAAKHLAEKEALRRHNEELIAKAEAEKARQAKLEEERIANEARRAEAERARMAETARIALEEARRAEDARRLAAEKAAAEKAASEKAAAEKKAEEERIAKAKTNEALAGGIRTKNYTYTSKTVRLLFRRSVDPNITARIYEIIKTTLEYYGKDKMYMRIKATIPDNTTVVLEFLEIPMEEMALLSDIIKILGNNGLGIAKAIVE